MYIYIQCERMCASKQKRIPVVVLPISPTKCENNKNIMKLLERIYKQLNRNNIFYILHMESDRF